MTGAHDSLFPLDLTAFERYMVFDDRPDFPMTFLFQLDFRGTVSRPELEATLPLAIRRHPLLTAGISGTGRQMVWVPRADSLPTIQWRNWGAPLNLPPGGERIDLRRETGPRVWIEHGVNRVRLSVQFHHASCDGMGALRFLGDWLAAYHAAIEKTAPQWPEVDPARLRARGDSRWRLPAQPVSFWTATSSRVREIVKWIQRRPVPLALVGGPRPASQASRFPGILSATLTPEETTIVRRRAKEFGATMNDLLLYELLRVIAEWNREHGRQVNDRDWLQVNIPTNLRHKADASMPAASVIGYVFLARRQSDCISNTNRLLESIRTEMEAVRKWNLGMYFLDGLASVEKVPGAMRWFAGAHRCCATAVFTNLGDAARRLDAWLPRHDGYVHAGALRLERVIAVPPLRPQTRAVFAALVCASRLTVAIRTDPSVFDEKTTRDLLDRWCGRLAPDAIPRDDDCDA